MPKWANPFLLLNAIERATVIAQISAEGGELGTEMAQLPVPVRMAATAPLASGVQFTSLLNNALAKGALPQAPDNAGLMFGDWTLGERIGRDGIETRCC